MLAFLFLFNLYFTVDARSAACCGGGFSSAALITGDDKASITSSISQSHIDTEVTNTGIWKKRANRETDLIFRLEGSQIFADRFQYGGSLPFVKRTLESGESSQGLGDGSFNLGYEFLPDWDYNPWRPKGFAFFQLTLPTGKSINEAEDPRLLDSRGRGFWALGFGASLLKTIRFWDWNSSFELHRSLPKSTYSGQAAGDLELVPGWGGTFTIGTGLNWKAWRLGTSLTWNYEDPVKVNGAIHSNGAAQRFTTGSVAVSYIWSDEWSSAFSYADQSLFGHPLNTTLGKSLQLGLQKHWSR